ncbi:MAG TPA: hypothetical protein VF407_11040 [Polyangiaceae bacterium]
MADESVTLSAVELVKEAVRSSSASHVARVLGLSEGAIRNWINDRKLPGPSNVHAIIAKLSREPVSDPNVNDSARGVLGSANDELRALALVAKEELTRVRSDPSATPKDRAQAVTNFNAILASLARSEAVISEAKVIAHPAFTNLLDRIVSALEPFPDGAKAVLDALKREDGAK